jgi:hypothetical protein
MHGVKPAPLLPTDSERRRYNRPGRRRPRYAAVQVMYGAPPAAVGPGTGPETARLAQPDSDHRTVRVGQTAVTPLGQLIINDEVSM